MRLHALTLALMLGVTGLSLVGCGAAAEPLEVTYYYLPG